MFLQGNDIYEKLGQDLKFPFVGPSTFLVSLVKPTDLQTD